MTTTRGPMPRTLTAQHRSGRPRPHLEGASTTMPELAINGGTQVRSTDYPAWPVVDDEVVAAVTDVVRSGEGGGFPGPGGNGAACEEAFAAYQGAAHGVLMMNGTVTMEVACKALDIGWGDEV